MRSLQYYQQLGCYSASIIILISHVSMNATYTEKLILELTEQLVEAKMEQQPCCNSGSWRWGVQVNCRWHWFDFDFHVHSSYRSWCQGRTTVCNDWLYKSRYWLLYVFLSFFFSFAFCSVCELWLYISGLIA